MTNKYPVPCSKLFLFLTALIILLAVPVFPAAAEDGIRSITFHYSGAGRDQETITVEFCDEWLLQPNDIYNHKLMQASFGLAAAGFRDKEHDLSRKDFNILDFFSQLKFSGVRTEDFNRVTSIDTIGTAIAHKKVGDAEVIAVSVSGNNYQNEWQSNLTVDDENRPEGFNTAADKVWTRLMKYIEDYKLSGNLRLWISGYSRAAAVSNITAADAVDSGLFDAVYGYTIATPRTTRDDDAGRYAGIFNIINPFDPVPMVPFPEWGFVRYGTDLFLPSMETDSAYAEKKQRADEYCMAAMGHPLHYNPQVNSQLHTILDMSLYFISSSKSYRDTYQSGILDIWQNRDFTMLVVSIIDRLNKLPEITTYQWHEFTEMLDYLMQIAYTNLRNHFRRTNDPYWDRSLPLKENMMHEHYDEVYRSWLFSSDDPDEIFMNDPRYFHYSVLGDVDVEVFDSEGRFVLRVDSKGKISADPKDSKDESLRDVEPSPVKLYASRQDKQTLIIFPMDREFFAFIRSDQDADVRTAYVEYSAKKLRGDVQYALSESMIKGEYVAGNIAPGMIDELTDEELLKFGFHKIEPWSRDIVYSPAAVMRLENTGIFHPAATIFLTFGGLLLIFALFLLILSLIGAGKGVSKGVRVIRDRRKARSEEQKIKENDQIQKAGALEAHEDHK